MRVLDAEAVRAALPMPAAIRVARRTFEALAAGVVEQPERQFIQLSQPDMLVGLMPCGVRGDWPLYTVKLITIVEGNAARGLPGIHGTVTVFDGETGAPMAVLDGAAITAIRTAAVSGLATDLLAAPDAGDLAVLGAGVQGHAHLEAMASVRDLRRVRVWNRTPGRAEAFAGWARSLGHTCEVAATPAEAVAGADLVCVCTGAHEALLTADDVSSGTHVNAVGAFSPDTRELAADLVARARVYVDDLDAAKEEAGDIVLAVAEGLISWDHVRGSLVDLVTADVRVARGPDDVSLFKSVGISAEDAFAAAAALGIAPIG